MDNDQEFFEPVLRVIAGAVIAAGLTAFSFGVPTLFYAVLTLLAVFGGGMVVSVFVILSAWVCLGSERLSAFMDKPSPYVWLVVYLAFSAASGTYFYPALQRL
jgi:hypothetical protein